MTFTHLLKGQPSDDHRLIAKSTSEELRQGMIVLLDTANDRVVKATDTTTNRKAGGVVAGWDQPNAGEEVRVDIGGGKYWYPTVVVAPGTGGTVELASGGSGSVDTVTADGVEILQGAVSYSASLANTASLVAKQINQNNTRFYATVSSATVTIKERIATKESFTVASTATTISTNDVNASGGWVPDMSNIGDSAYVSSETKVTPTAGNAIIGTYDDIADENDDAQVHRAGFGTVEITGGSGSITDLTVGGTSLVTSAVSFSTDAETTAGLLRDEINSGIGTHKYFAVKSGAQVHIYQTTDSVSEDIEDIVVTGALTTKVVRDVKGGRLARCLIKMRAYGAALT